ncbi:MAG: tetratricopeptide repeat protein [Thermodesulfobacteriota bacterium]
MADKNKILMKAQQYVLKGATEKAIKEYIRVLEVDPQDIIVRLRLGELYARVGSKEEAIEEYSKVAKVQTQKGFLLKAIAIYKQILKLDMSNIEAHLMVGELYRKQGLLADAISQYGRVVEKYEKAESYNEAINVLKKMLDIDPNNMSVKTRLANSLYDRGFVEDAVVEFEAVAERFIEKGDPDNAEKIYRKLLEGGVDKVKTLKGLLKVYKLANKNGALLEICKKLLRLYREAGLEEDSKDICRDILKIDPQDKDALAMLAEEDKESVDSLITTLEIDDEDMIEVLPEEYVDLVAELGLEEETPSEMGAEMPGYRGEQTSEEGDLETHYYMGVAYMETGLLDEAIKEFETASDSPKVVFDSYVRLGLCYMRKKEPREAIKYFKMGLNIPRNTKDRYSLFYELGLAYEALGERDKALEFFKEIEKEDRDFREVRMKIEALSA